jgi:ribonuclease P protein component
MPSAARAPAGPAAKAMPMRRRSDFDAVMRHGRPQQHRLFTLRLRPNSLGRVRYGFATGRRLGGAVQRNRVRRRLRAVMRELGPREGFDVFVAARPAIVQASYEELRAGLTTSVANALAGTGEHS